MSVWEREMKEILNWLDSRPCSYILIMCLKKSPFQLPAFFSVGNTAKPAFALLRVHFIPSSPPWIPGKMSRESH